MPITITIGTDGVFMYDGKAGRPNRPEKGRSVIAFPRDCVVIDLETTGLEPQFDNIIEFAGIRVRDGRAVDTYQTLIKPYDEIDEFITELTGITNEMLSDAPAPETVFPFILDFIGEDIVVGHSVSFDVNFLYDWFKIILQHTFTNNYVDTLRISRKIMPELPHHRLKDVAAALEIMSNGYHRALFDCQTTFDCFNRLRDITLNQYGTEEEFKKLFRKRIRAKLDMRAVTSENTDFDETNPLFGKHCVFTGVLEKMARAEAAQHVVDLGGICDNGITKKTNFLILGNNDYCSTIKDGKSTKHKKAEEYRLKGYDIQVIPENVFYDMLDE